MTTVVVLDGQGLHTWARRRPPRDVVALMEVLRRAGTSRVLVPSVVLVEAFRGDARDAPVDHARRDATVLEDLPVDLARAAARLRQETDASAVDAVVAATAVRHGAAYVVSSDPTDLDALFERATPPVGTVVVRV